MQLTLTTALLYRNISVGVGGSATGCFEIFPIWSELMDYLFLDYALFTSSCAHTNSIRFHERIVLIHSRPSLAGQAEWFNLTTRLTSSLLPTHLRIFINCLEPVPRHGCPRCMSMFEESPQHSRYEWEKGNEEVAGMGEKESGKFPTSCSSRIQFWDVVLSPLLGGPGSKTGIKGGNWSVLPIRWRKYS